MARKVETNANGVELTITIPMKQKEGRDFHPSFEYIVKETIRENRDIILNALNQRMIHCYDELVNHTGDIIFNDGNHIRWCDEDGKEGYFNVPSYNTMEDAMKALHQGDYQHFVNNIAAADQILKALYAYEEMVDVSVISTLIQIIMFHEK